MNIRKVGITAVAIGTLWFAGMLVAHAATHEGTPAPAAIGLGAGSTLWLEGTSNLHEFESRTSQVVVAFTRDPETQNATDVASLETMIRASAVRGLDLKVPVTSLHSGKSGLDKNLYKALHADDYPQIKFHLAHYTVTPRAAGNDTLNIHAEGVLTVAGKEQPSTLEARVYRGEHGVWLEGSELLLMSTFGIKPPTMMLGTLRVNDKIMIRYRLLLAPASMATTATSDNTH
jgi:hypothetical protein